MSPRALPKVALTPLEFIVDAIQTAKRNSGGDETKYPARIELHPEVFRSLVTHEETQQLLRYSMSGRPSSWVDTIGVEITASVRVTEPRMFLKGGGNAVLL